MFPEITVTDLAAKLESDEKFVLLDVREPVELDYAKIEDERLALAPVSELSEGGPDALPEAAKAQDATIYVICHHGNRSMQVTAWLSQQGWTNIFNVKGGIDAYARIIDDSVGVY